MTHKGCAYPVGDLAYLATQPACWDIFPFALQHSTMHWAARHRWLGWAAYRLRSAMRLRMPCCLLALVALAMLLGTPRAMLRSPQWR